MKFSCYRNDLMEALQFVVKAVAVRPMTPAISGIYIRAENNMAEFHANDFTLGISARIPVNTTTTGESLVSGKRFFEFVRNLSDDTLTISNDFAENTLTVEAGGANVELLTMDPEDFPRVRELDDDIAFKISTLTLRHLLRKTLFAASKDDARPIFTGCCFEIRGDKISVVATNTHRLALISADLPEKYGDFTFVVPADSLRALMSGLNPTDVDDNYVTVKISSRYISLTYDNVMINMRVIEGMFPSYDRVIPASNTTRVTVDKKEFQSAVELVALMARENEYNNVKLSFSGDCVEVSSNSPEVGGANKSVTADIEGADLDISFNVNYIVDILRAVDSKSVIMEFNDQYSPAAFKEPGNSNYVYVATPVRA